MGSGCIAPPFLTSVLDSGGWSASRPDRFIRFEAGSVGHKDRSGRCKVEKFKIWGFHGGDYEEWCLLGCYAVWLL
jgi:hypothetical protein